ISRPPRMVARRRREGNPATAGRAIHLLFKITAGSRIPAEFVGGRLTARAQTGFDRGSREGGCMRASEIRGKVLADHAQLGAMLREVGRHAWRGVDGKHDARAPLLVALGALAPPFRIHLEVEERLLAPLLEPIAAWGPMDLLETRVNHAHQREQLDALLEATNDPWLPLPLYAAEVVAFVRGAIQEMEREERAILHPDTVRPGLLAHG